jgi:hypothetical protein
MSEEIIWVASSIQRLVLTTPSEQRMHDETTKLTIFFHGLSRLSYCIATVIRMGWIDSFNLDPDYTLFICHGLDQEGKGLWELLCLLSEEPDVALHLHWVC